MKKIKGSTQLYILNEIHKKGFISRGVLKARFMDKFKKSNKSANDILGTAIPRLERLSYLYCKEEKKNDVFYLTKRVVFVDGEFYFNKLQ